MRVINLSDILSYSAIMAGCIKASSHHWLQVHLISSERPGFASGVLSAAGPQILLNFLLRSESPMFWCPPWVLDFARERYTIECALSNHEANPCFLSCCVADIQAAATVAIVFLWCCEFHFLNRRVAIARFWNLLLISNINELVGSLNNNETLVLPHSRQMTWVRQPSSTERKDCQWANFCGYYLAKGRELP